MIRISPYPHAKEDFGGFIKTIEDYRQVDSYSMLGVGKGPVWSSPKTLFGIERLQRFRLYVEHLHDRMITELWANVMQKGSEIERHNHHRPYHYCVAGAYYVTPGTIHLEGYGQFDIEAGNILVFPGDLMHWVPEYTGEESRISVAWNMI